MKEKLLRHCQGNPNMFDYGGIQFCPYRRLTNEEATLQYAMRHAASDFELGLRRADYPHSKYPYNHKDFYNKTRAKKCDLFVCVQNGKLYLPCENELFEWRGDVGKANPEFEKTAREKTRKKDYER